jgi:hypothetical protein
MFRFFEKLISPYAEGTALPLPMALAATGARR